MPGQRNGRSSPETYRAWVAKDFASAKQGLPLELLGVAPATRQSGLHGLHLWSPAEAFLPPWHKLSFQRTRKWTWPWWRQYQNIHLFRISAGNGPQGDFGLLWRSIPCEYPRMQIHWYSTVGGLLLTCPHKPCSTHAEQIWPQPRDFACATWQSSVLLAAWQTMQFFSLGALGSGKERSSSFYRSSYRTRAKKLWN